MVSLWIQKSSQLYHYNHWFKDFKIYRVSSFKHVFWNTLAKYFPSFLVKKKGREKRKNRKTMAKEQYRTALWLYQWAGPLPKFNPLNLCFIWLWSIQGGTQWGKRFIFLYLWQEQGKMFIEKIDQAFYGWSLKMNNVKLHRSNLTWALADVKGSSQTNIVSV